MDMKKVKEAEHKAFEDHVEDIAGAGALQLWIKDNPSSGYANERVNDYRSGWVACLEWLEWLVTEPSTPQERAQWIDDNVTGNPSLIRAMKLRAGVEE